jgi:hypothetical protein
MERESVTETVSETLTDNTMIEDRESEIEIVSDRLGLCCARAEAVKDELADREEAATLFGWAVTESVHVRVSASGILLFLPTAKESDTAIVSLTEIW